MSKELKTGDILFTQGTGFFATVIRIFTFAWFKWNHVAAVVFRGGEPWVYEVTSQDSFPDGITGLPRNGCRTESLESWLSRQGKVWVGRLVKPLDRRQHEEFNFYWDTLHKSNIHYDYLGAVFSAIPGSVASNKTSTFCSAAVAAALVSCGKLNTYGTPVNELHPHDISKLYIIHQPERLK